MNKKLILNVITLATTTLLLVLVMFSWYVTNKEVRATGIIAGTAADDYTLHLERGTYTYSTDTTKNKDAAKNGGWYWEWKETDSMTFSDIQPGDAFFFRIVMETTEAHEFNVNFGGVVSSLMEDTLYGYNSRQLVEYTKTTDTVKNPEKNYYFATFTAATVTTGYPVRPYTYYIKKTENNKDYYELTDDEEFQAGTTYYNARFTLEEFPDFKKNTYYEKGTPSDDVNAIGYKIADNQYNFLYPLFSDNTVKITDEKTLYAYDDTEDTVSLVDYKIEDVFKVYDIGLKKTGAANLYHDNFYRDDTVYEFNYTKLTSTSVFSADKTYYTKIENNPASVYDGEYVKVVNPVEANKTSYYERSSIKLDSNNKQITKYNSEFLKDSNYSFDTENNDNGVTYYYFALEFNDEASIENIYGTLSSNCYLYQKLRIGELKVENADSNN